MPVRRSFAEGVLALRSTSKDLCSFLLHELLFCSEVGIGIDSRYEVPVSLKQARCNNAKVQIGAQALCHGNIRQIRFLQNLPVNPSFLGKDSFQLHHEASLFVKDLQDLISRGRNTVEVVRDDIRCACRHIPRRLCCSGLLRPGLLRLLRLRKWGRETNG